MKIFIMSNEVTRVVLISILLWNVHGFPDGAPDDTCLTMFPKHGGAQSRTGQSPFRILLSTNTYMPSQIMNITLSAIDKTTFIGIQIRAHRESGDTEEILGSFISYPESKTKTYNCFGGKQNMVTHKNKDRVTEINLTWKAPDHNVGNIVFVATFVESYQVFWYNVRKVLNTHAPVKQPLIEKVSNKTSEIQFEECGKTIGCFLYPKFCTGSNCDVGMTYRSGNDNVTIQLFAKAEGYVSIGFSDDRKMGGDQTITCTADDDRVTIQHGFNPHLYNDRQTVSGRFKDMQSKKVDGKIQCTFTRPKAMIVLNSGAPNGTVEFDLDNQYYVMIAWGHIYIGTDVIGHHKELPVTTATKVNFREYIIHRGDALPMLTQVHGILMLVAWIFFGGITTVIARHYRNCLNRNILGSQLWFQVHRAFALITFLLTAASFVIIFLKVDGLTKKAEKHGYTGIAVMSATTLQLLMGVLRPNPESVVRSAFNWIHWFLGKSTHILAAAAYFLAFNVSFIPVTQKFFGTVVIAVWVGVQITAEIAFEIKKYRESDSKSKYEKTDDKKQNGSTTRSKVMLIIYIITLALVLSAASMAVFFF